MYKIAHNLSINYLKRNKTINFSPLDCDVSVPREASVEDAIEAKVINEEIYSLLKKIDPLLRSIFIMRKELNFKVKKISDITGIAERTVRRRIDRVVNYLYSALKKNDFFNQ